MKRAGVFLLLAVCLVGAGCTPFTNFWRKCNAAACCASGCDLSGCWEGCWRSEKCGHKGPLHAILTRCDDCHYHARFHARFWKFFTYEYEVVLNAIPQGEYWCLSGAKRLGIGMFHYSGTATPCHFHCRYHSCNDYGVFVLDRKCCECR